MLGDDLKQSTFPKVSYSRTEMFNAFCGCLVKLISIQAEARGRLELYEDLGPTVVGWSLAWLGLESKVLNLDWTTQLCSVILQGSIGHLPPRCPQVEGRLSHFLPRCLRTGWQRAISLRKIPWNIPSWLGIEPGPRGGQTVSYPTELSWLTSSGLVNMKYGFVFGSNWFINFTEIKQVQYWRFGVRPKNVHHWISTIFSQCGQVKINLGLLFLDLMLRVRCNWAFRSQAHRLYFSDRMGGYPG